MADVAPHDYDNDKEYLTTWRLLWVDILLYMKKRTDFETYYAQREIRNGNAS